MSKRILKLNRLIITEQFSGKQIAAYIGMVGSQSRDINKVLNFLFGDHKAITKQERLKWKQTVTELDNVPVVTTTPYIKINIGAVRKIMTSGLRYKNNLLAFYVFLVSKQLYDYHITVISYATIVKEHKIDRNNAVKYVAELEKLKIMDCCRKTIGRCNIYVPCEYRDEFKKYCEELF